VLSQGALEFYSQKSSRLKKIFHRGKGFDPKRTPLPMPLVTTSSIKP